MSMLGITMTGAPPTDLEALWARLERDGPLAPWDLPTDALDAEWSERRSTQQDRRRTFIAFYGWAVPSPAAIEAIAAFAGSRTLLEICAGSGLWARLLATAGAEVIATDALPSRDSDYFLVEAQEADAAVRAHPECDALLVCWPPFRDPCAFHALRAFRGDRLAYVGDSRFTADSQFHALLAAEWTLHQQILIPAWPGLDDYAYLHTRKQPQRR